MRYRQAASTLRYTRWVLLCGIILFVYAIYVPSIRMTLFYDDAINVQWMGGRNLLNVFSNYASVDINYRPISYALWLLVRDLFGWFSPPLLHMWNVWLHTLNMALVAAFVTRLCRLFRIKGALLPVITTAIFGLYPFSYEAVLWASAVNHLIMMSLGMAALLMYIRARQASDRRILWLLLCALFLVAACFSNESGIIFGFLLLLVEGVYAVQRGEHPRLDALWLGGVSAAYALLYRFLVTSVYTRGGAQPFILDAGAWLTNFTIHAQGMAAWLIILLRKWIGLPESRMVIVLALFAVSVVLALVALWRLRLLRFGLFALAWWAVAIAPSTLLLIPSYVFTGPRLQYESSLGIALFWGLMTAGIYKALHRQLVIYVLLAGVAVLLAWCVSFISVRRDAFSRLTPALNQIDADMRKSDAQAKVLLVNMPLWVAPANPDFLLGNEGIQIYQHDGSTPWSWLASVSGLRRDTRAVRHEASLTHGSDWSYVTFGDPVDDTGLRAAVLAANLIYRFDYDAPGLRVQKLAEIGSDTPVSAPLAVLSNGPMQVLIRSARATVCGDSIVMNVVWSDALSMSQPVGVFVHVLDAQGRQIVVADKDPLDGYLPLNAFPAGRVVSETRLIAIPPNTAAPKTVQVGAYLRADGKRLTAVRADGRAWDGDIVAVPVDDAGSDLCIRY